MFNNLTRVNKNCKQKKVGQKLLTEYRCHSYQAKEGSGHKISVTTSENSMLSLPNKEMSQRGPSGK